MTGLWELRVGMRKLIMRISHFPLQVPTFYDTGLIAMCHTSKNIACTNTFYTQVSLLCPHFKSTPYILWHMFNCCVLTSIQPPTFYAIGFNDLSPPQFNPLHSMTQVLLLCPHLNSTPEILRHRFHCSVPTSIQPPTFYDTGFKKYCLHKHILLHLNNSPWRTWQLCAMLNPKQFFYLLHWESYVHQPLKHHLVI